MKARGLLGLALVVLLAVVLLDGDESRTLRVALENASGLESGSAVRIGGENIGKVELDLDEGDRVVATLRLDEDAPPVGRDVRVRVVAANFLGQKRVELSPGTVSDPAPSGFRVPAARTTTPTDLDQVLGVLDADTRTRLQILINEAGESLVGRKVDLRSFLEDFPIGLEDSTRLLRQLKTDNATMRNLVVRADRFVGAAAGERRDLGAMVEQVGETAETVAARRSQLRATLAKAPGTLGVLRATLGDLRATTTDLGPAAREITDVAPSLGGALREVQGFRRAAAPALEAATEVAPDLTRLGRRATPVLREALPTLRRLSALATVLPGVTDTLDGSAGNIFAVLQNWSRAIQFRDQLGHVFRGEAAFTRSFLDSAIGRLAEKPARRKTTARPGGRPAAPGDAAKAPESKALSDLLLKTPAVVKGLKRLPKNVTPDEVDKAVGDLLGGGKGDANSPSEQSSSELLDYLLAP